MRFKIQDSIRVNWKPSKKGPDENKRYGEDNIANRLFYCLSAQQKGLTRVSIHLHTGLTYKQIRSAIANLRNQGHVIEYCYTRKTFKLEGLSL